MLCRAVALAVCTMGVGVNAGPLSSRPVGTLSERFWGGDAAEREQLMDIKSGAACACSSKCRTGAPAKCTEALDIRVDPPLRGVDPSGPAPKRQRAPLPVLVAEDRGAIGRAAAHGYGHYLARKDMAATQRHNRRQRQR